MALNEREHHIDWLCRLKSNLKVFIPKDFHLAEFEQSLNYAISSLKTDEAYQLMYEGEEVYTKDEVIAKLQDIRARAWMHHSKFDDDKDFNVDRAIEDIVWLIDIEIGKLNEKELCNG